MIKFYRKGSKGSKRLKFQSFHAISFQNHYFQINHVCQSFFDNLFDVNVQLQTILYYKTIDITGGQCFIQTSQIVFASNFKRLCHFCFEKIFNCITTIMTTTMLLSWTAGASFVTLANKNETIRVNTCRSIKIVYILLGQTFFIYVSIQYWDAIEKLF